MGRTVLAPRQLLRLATAGSVDDGKSTLIGRLLTDTGSLPTDHVEAVTDSDGVVDLAALSDGLRAEREQGITIDVAYRFFSTERRKYILADTPGHEGYTRNMFTGASNAHVVVLLIDARKGVESQTRRHAGIAALLGIPHVVAAVNKIDAVDYDDARFLEIESEIRATATRAGLPRPEVIPVSALVGDNVVVRSQNMPWFEGPTLLEFLEDIDLPAPAPRPTQLRLPIQWATRPRGEGRRRYSGRLSAGALRVGDRIVVLPSGAETTVTALDTLDPERDVAVAPLSVSIEVADELDIGRGDTLVSAAVGAVPPVVARELDATVCWFSETPLRAGDRLLLKHGPNWVRTTVQTVGTRVDPETLNQQEHPAELAVNDLGRITIRTSSPVVADRYADNRDTGAFILVDPDTNATVGAGTVLDARVVETGARQRTDVTWHSSSLDRSHRWNSIGHRGATVWLTGLPASGKSTVGVELERLLVESGAAAYRLGGDNIRYGLCDDLGFAPGDRAENIRRVGHVARLFADAGVVAIASLVSPLKSDRDRVRELHEAAGLPFFEVHVDTPVEECARRDPKGLYARARSGQLRGLTGWDAPYEAPAAPEIRFGTTGADPVELAGRILEALNTLSDTP